MSGTKIHPTALVEKERSLVRVYKLGRFVILVQKLLLVMDAV